MERGANVNLKTFEWEVPLIPSILHKRVEITMKLLEYGANPNAPFLSTILHLACMYGDIVVVKALLKHDAKVTQRYLTHAITNAKIEMLETLLNHVPDINQFHTLSEAAFYEHINMVNMLIKYRADVNRNVDMYRPPLNKATYYGNVRTMSELLKNGANANLRDYKGHAPIPPSV